MGVGARGTRRDGGRFNISDQEWGSGFDLRACDARIKLAEAMRNLTGLCSELAHQPLLQR